MQRISNYILSCVAALGFTTVNAASFDPAAIATAEYAALKNAMCPPPGAAPADASGLSQAVEPVRVFDNLYFVGHRTTSAWALTTDAGIILLEAMFHDNVDDTIVSGLRKLDLDPANIKYVIVTHGHNDHFGGARYLQQTFGAHIVMSAIDWQHMRTWPQRGTPAPYPEQDIAVQDGDSITLGDTTVKIIVTPGHTPGTLSLQFPVRDQGRIHYVGYWGGGAVSYLSSAEIGQYITAARNYMDIDPDIDVELSNHAYIDGSMLKLGALALRQQSEKHPFVTGNAGFKRWMNTIIECAEEVLTQKKNKE